MSLSEDNGTGGVEAKEQEAVLTTKGGGIFDVYCESGGDDDDLMCTVCSQGLSRGAIRLEEHPIVPGVAVCPRCLENLLEEFRERQGEQLDEYCSWCGDDNDVQLFVCDKKDCGRAFCFGCIEKLGEGTAAALERSNDSWSCPCCDESPLAGLQAFYSHAEQNPPLLARVLARLAEEAVVALPSRDDRSGEGSGGSGNGDSSSIGDAELLMGVIEGGEGRARGQEDDAFDQELIDAACVVDREISITLEQMEIAAWEKRTKEISEEIRKGGPHLSPEEFQDELSAEQQRVHEMWQHNLDALMEVQANVKDALADRGLSEAEIAIRDAGPTAPGESAVEDNANERKEDTEARGGDFLRHLESTAEGAGGTYDAANALLQKCNALWEATLRKLLAAANEDGSTSAACENLPGGGALSDVGNEGVVDVSRSPVFDLRFFWAAARSANELPGSGPRWTEEGLASGAERALELFRKGQAVGVDSPTTEDIKGWGLTGERAEQLGILIRWLKNQLVMYERAREESQALPRFIGEEGDKKHPPSEREALSAECRVLERQIKALNEFWDGAMGPDVWASMSDADMKDAWRRLRVELHATVQDAESIAPLLETVGAGGVDAREFQAEDLGTSAEAWMTSTLKADRVKWRLGSTAQATRKLKEAVAREGVVAVKERSEVEDSKELSKERRRAVGASSKPRRPTISRVRRRPRTKANGAFPSCDRHKSPGLTEAKKKNTAKDALGSRKVVADRGPAAATAAAAAESGTVGVSGSDGDGLAVSMEEEDDDMDTGFVYDSDSWPSADVGNEGGVVVGDGTDCDAAAAVAASPDAPRIPRDVDDDREGLPTRSLDNGGGNTGFVVQSLVDSDAPNPGKLSEGDCHTKVSKVGCSNSVSEAKSKGRDGGTQGGRAATSDAEGGGGADHPVGSVGADTAVDEKGRSDDGVMEKGGAIECSPDDLVGILKAMGVEDNDIVKPEGRAELEKLLNLSRGNVALAVEWFFERATKTRAKEKERVARRASLRTRDGPLGAGCYICESRLPGEWKRMKRGARAEGDYRSTRRPSIAVNEDKAGSGFGACGSGGGGGWRRRSSDRAPYLSDSCSEDDQGRMTDRFDSSASDEDEVSSNQKGKRRGRKARMSHHKKVVMGRPLPPSLWICAREDCLEVAEDIGCVVEALYPMEHVTWTEETELGPDRLARTHGYRREKLKANGSCKDSPPNPGSTSLVAEGVNEGCGRENCDAESRPDLFDVDQSEGDGDMEMAVNEPGSSAEGTRDSRADERPEEPGAKGPGEHKAKEPDEERGNGSDQRGAQGPGEHAAKEPDEKATTGSNEQAATGPDEQVATGPAEQGAKGPAEQTATGPAEHAATGPDEQAATGPDEQAATGPDEQEATGPDEQAATGPDEQATTGPDEQAAMGPDEQATTGPDEQAATGPDEQAATGPDEQAAMGPDEQEATGPGEQAAKGPDKCDEIVKREAELREACAVVLGKKSASLRAAAMSANDDGRQYSSTSGDSAGGKAVSGEDSTGSRRDGSSFRLPIIVVDGDEESEERSSAESATDEGGEDRSMNGERKVEEEGGENAGGGEGDSAGSGVVGVCTAPGCGKPSHGLRDGVCARCRASGPSSDQASATDGGKRACAGPGCNRQVTAAKVHGADDSLCSLCLAVLTGGGFAGLDGHPEGGDSVNGDAGRRREGPARVGGSAEGSVSGQAARPQKLREVVDLAFSDEEEEFNISPRPPIGGGRSFGAVERTRAREGGGERGAIQSTSNPRFGSPFSKKASNGHGATTSPEQPSLNDFWGASSAGDSRGRGNNPETLVEDRRRRGLADSSMSGVRTPEAGAAAAGKLSGEGIRKDRENEEGNRRRSTKVGPALNGGGGGNANEGNDGDSKGSDDGTESPIIPSASKGKGKSQKRRKILSDSDLGSDFRGGSSSGDGDLADSDFDVDAHGSDSEDLVDMDDSEEVEEDDDDDDDVVFQGVEQGRRREGPLDEKQEREVAGLREKEKERLKAIEERKFRSPPKTKIRRVLPQSRMCPMDVEVVDESEYSHVLEVLPAEDGKSDTEAKAVTIAPFLGRHLFEHQIEGVQFMYDNLVVNVEQLRGGGEGSAGNGCILAHCMGLGKTLQAVTIMHVLLSNELVQEAATFVRKDPTPASGDAGTIPRGASISSSVSGDATVSTKSGPGTRTSFLRTCLVLVPKNVLRNWEDELKKWLREYHRQGKVFVVDRGKLEERRSKMELWHERGGILVMSYTVFRIMTSQADDEGKHLRKLLLDPGPDVVVADEAHLLKNEEAKVTVAIKKLRTKRRVALTGSPLQNNLVEYYTMVDFVRKGMLGDLYRFKSYFEAPILNGMLVDSSPQDVKKSHGRSHVLHETLRGFVQRKDVTVMAKSLPPHVKKEEIVLTVALTKRQKGLTQKIFREAKQLDSKGLLMRVLTSLQLAWTHPEVYESDKAKKAARAAAKAADDGDVTDDDSTSGGATKGSVSLAEMSGDESASTRTERSRKRLKNATVEEKTEEGPSSTGKPPASSSSPGNSPLAAEAGVAAVVNASGKLNPIENGGGGSGGGESNGFLLGCSSDIIANYPAAVPPMRSHWAVEDLEAADVTSMSTIDLASQGIGSGGGSDLCNRGGLARGSADFRAPGSDPLECNAKRPRLGIAEGKEARGGSVNSAEIDVRGEGVFAAGRDAAERLVGVVGAAYAATSAAAVAVDPVTAPYGKKRKKHGAMGKTKGAMKEKLRCLGDEVDIGESAKMVIAMEIIARAIHQGDKVLVFSQRTPVLDFFERVFMTPGFGGTLKTPPPPSIYPGASEWGSWKNGRHYFRLDGSTSSTKRQAMIDEFNRRHNKTARVFLLSTRAGNMGINLVAANRVILMDTSWNPANDLQAMFRCYRFGQTKPVEVYRLVMGRSLENKMHNKQITKHALAKRVVDARNPGRKLTMADQTLNLDAEYSRYEDNPQEAGLAASASVPLAVTEQDAQTLTVDNERLADLLGIREVEERGRSEGRESSAVGAEASGRDNRENYGFPSSQLLNSSLGPGLGAAQSRPSSSVASSGLLIPPARPTLVWGAAGAEAKGKTRANLESGEDKATVEDAVLKHLLEEFHPQYITSWVANKHLLEDDPLEKLDDAGKAEAKRQYDEELKLQDQIDRQLKDMGALVQEQLRPGAQQRAALAALMQQKQLQQQGLARQELSQEGFARLVQQQQQRQEQLTRLGFIEQEQRNRLREIREQFSRDQVGGGERRQQQQYQGQPRQGVDKISQPIRPSAVPTAGLGFDFPRSLARSTASMPRTILNSVAEMSAGMASALTGMGNRGGDYAGPSGLQDGSAKLGPLTEKPESPSRSENGAGVG